jgi:hypothetical protein
MHFDILCSLVIYTLATVAFYLLGAAVLNRMGVIPAARDTVAAPPGFQTLLRHPTGRGRTRLEAIEDLVVHPEFIHRARMGEWSPEPRLSDFVEMRAPKWTTWAPFTNIDLLAEGANSAPQDTTRMSGRETDVLRQAATHRGGADGL